MENKTVEYKSALNKKDWRSWLKTIVAFSNTEGGSLFLFYGDDGSFIGTDKEKADEERRYLVQTIRSHTEPTPLYEIKDIERDGRVALEVAVKKREGITWLLDTGENPRVYVREEGETVPATLSQITERFVASLSIDYDSTPVEMKADPARFSRLKTAFERENPGIKFDLNQMVSLGVCSPDGHLTIAGRVFEDGSDYRNANLSITVYATLSKGEQKFLDSKLMKGGALELIEDTIEYLKGVSYCRNAAEVVGMQRKNRESFSVGSIREALVNAFAHRDYTINGSEIAVDCYPDRIEVTSPGNLPRGQSIQKSGYLYPLPSIRRNEAICRVFFSIGLMDTKGSGFLKIISDYRGWPETHRPRYYASGPYFRLVLMSKTYSLGVSEKKPSIYSDALKSVEEVLSSSPSLRLVHDGIRRGLNIPAMAGELGMSRQAVSYNIRKLKEARIVVSRGRGAATVYSILDDSLRPYAVRKLPEETLSPALSLLDGYRSASPLVSTKEASDYLLEKGSFLLREEEIEGLLILAGYSPIESPDGRWANFEKGPTEIS